MRYLGKASQRKGSLSWYLKDIWDGVSTGEEGRGTFQKSIENKDHMYIEKGYSMLSCLDCGLQSQTAWVLITASPFISVSDSSSVKYINNNNDNNNTSRGYYET